MIQSNVISRKFVGGHYATIDLLLTELNRHFRQMTVDITLKYDSIQKKVIISGDGKYSICFFGSTAYALGFEPDVWISVNNRRTAPYCSDIKAGLYTFYLYCDISAYQIVGDSYSPLLRMIDISGNFGDIITCSFDKPHYVQLSRKHIETIHVVIKSDQNQTMPFTYGKVVVKLHFRPSKRIGY